MREIKDISLEEWNAARTKINMLEEEILELKKILPRALDKNFVKKQIGIFRQNIKKLKKMTEPKL